MAKNKKKNNQNKNSDDKINLMLRMNYGNNVNALVNELMTSFPLPLVKEVMSQIKDVYFKMDKREVEGLADDVHFMNILNYIEEIFIAIEVNPGKELVDIATFFRKKIVEYHRMHNIKWELFIYINKVAVLLENPKLYENGRYDSAVSSLIAKAITDILYCFYHYCFTYVEKIKNKKLSKFVQDGKHIVLKYESTLFVENQLVLDAYFNCCNNIPLNQKQKKCILGVMSEINRIYSNFVTRDINPDYNQEVNGCLAYKGDLRLPIISDKEKALSDEQLCKFPFGRKYAFSSAGVRFNFINKELGVDYIDMIETKEHINLNVFLINDGKYYMNDKSVNGLDWVVSRELKAARKAMIPNEDKPVYGKRIQIPFYIIKKDFKEGETLQEKLAHISPLGYNYNKNNPESINLFVGLVKLVLSCIYCAYYDLNIFKGILSIGSREKSQISGNSKSSRETSFRVAHLRKLPMGHKASSDSINNAKKEGFDYIEEGYTFVRAFVPDEAKKRVINIKK